MKCLKFLIIKILFFAIILQFCNGTMSQLPDCSGGPAEDLQICIIDKNNTAYESAFPDYTPG